MRAMYAKVRIHQELPGMQRYIARLILPRPSILHKDLHERSLEYELRRLEAVLILRLIQVEC